MTTISNVASQLLAENNYVVDSSSVSFTAQNILDENNYTTSNISLVNLELVLMNAVGYVNMQTNSSIAMPTGTAGSKTATMTNTQAALVKSICNLMIKAYVDRGPNVSIAGLSVSTVIADPQYSLFTDLIKSGMVRLRTLAPSTVELLINNAVDYVNLQTNRSIAHLSGSSGSMSLTAQDNEISIVKLLVGLYIRDVAARGFTDDGKLPSASDPVYGKLIMDGIMRLRGRGILRTYQ